MKYNFIDALNYRKNTVSYDKNLVKLTGGVIGAIILQQIIYWDDRMGGEFFKFTSPSNNDSYKEGDSWEEELGVSKKTFNNAIKKFAFKKGKSKNIINEEDAIVTYYTNGERKTFYKLNRELLAKGLKGIYLESDQRAFTIESDQRAFTIESDQRAFTIPTETTKEYTDSVDLDLEKETITSSEQEKEKNPQGAAAPFPPDLQKLFEDFLDDRKQRKKKNTERSTNLIISKLKKMSCDEERMQSLELSIENGRTSVYEVKGFKPSKVQSVSDGDMEKIREKNRLEHEENMRKLLASKY